MSKRTKEKLLKKMDKEMDNSDFERAIKLANEIIKLDPAESEAYICKFISLIKLGKENEASDLFENILDNLTTTKDIGDVEECLINMKEYDKANELYNKVYELDPDFYDFFETTLLNYINFDTFIEFLNYLDKNTPRWEDLYFLKAALLSNFEKYEKTIVVCDEILEEFPNHENSHSKKAFCLSVLDRDEEFKEILEHMIKNNIRSNWASVDMGGYYLKKGDYDKAISIVDEVLENEPGYGYALFMRANFMCIENKDLTEALDYLNQALEGEQDSRYYNIALGLKYNILNQLGREKEAEKAFEEYNSARIGNIM